MIVADQRVGTKELNGMNGDADTDGVESNTLWRTLSKQVGTLRAEQEESLKSVDEAAQNGISSTGRHGR